MTKNIGNMLVGFVMLTVGGALIYWGYSEAESLSGQIGRAFSGSPSNRVLAFYIGGVVCGLLGLVMAFKR